ncbi:MULTISPECIES: hypothetical protein [Brevibacillus]|jgi:hypothetical protein|uniref:Uncharacterized protein n=1 Tax=Brevibacillus borstelensis AK1 TaxID=1300222 RepID=M8DU01_9BACL|nr:hypothetical protein [Brevibacillus borstelensis]EMT50466.1 hypothetical protein I532_22285 [Brevibacillus borstelensis AK1]KKX53410.1 hypothetical protein X546_19840 [Brevibacillus borstelensis cifa_chp40]MBE5396552.1 hypothetical protein [Brevibacillus borstelensis]MCC0565929.1 hypothetical protein [Brevibacillus borstelensis]MCM3471685.1 hypothetical protein [Brevibacillus borstelensis]
MGPTRLRYTMIGFIVGVVVVYLKGLPISEGVRFAFPFYGAGLGLLIDGIILRLKQRKGKNE